MTTPTTNTAQAARPLLAVLDDKPDTVNAILDEAHRAPGGLPGLLSAMTSAVLEILIGTAGGTGHARRSTWSCSMSRCRTATPANCPTARPFSAQPGLPQSVENQVHRAAPRTGHGAQHRDRLSRPLAEPPSETRVGSQRVGYHQSRQGEHMTSAPKPDTDDTVFRLGPWRWWSPGSWRLAH
jgi:hypothetical protein